MEPTLKYTRVPNNPTCILVESFHSHLELSIWYFENIDLVQPHQIVLSCKPYEIYFYRCCTVIRYSKNVLEKRKSPLTKNPFECKEELKDTCAYKCLRHFDFGY